MLRTIPVLGLLVLLAGCAAPSYRYYGERQYVDDAYPVVDGRYAAPGYSGSVLVGDPLHWVDYPAYYSLFWGLNRWYVDPYWHPHFYYGVTWFPRNYYSVIYRSWRGPSLYTSSWYGRPWYGYLSYSPYRLSWADHYYDWYPWYWHHPNRFQHYAPRYGNVRNEAERLSRYSAWHRGHDVARSDGRPLGRWSQAARSQDAVESRREALRGADYSQFDRRGRIDPGVSGFRQGAAGSPPSRPTARGEASTYGRTSPRQDPQVSGFREPASAPRPSAPVRREAAAVPTLRERPATSTRGELGITYPARPARSVETTPRYGSTTRESAPARPLSRRDDIAPRYETPRRESPRYATPAESPRYSAPPRPESPRQSAPRRESPSYSAPPREQPRYAAPERNEPRYSAPAPRQEPRLAAPRETPRYSAPEPSPAPRYQAPSRPEPRSERDSGARDEARRVRDDER